MDLITEARQKSDLLDKASTELKKRGLAAAESERLYRVATAKKTLIERGNGTPATLIEALVKGEEEVAMLKFNRDRDEVLYKSCLEAINIMKVQLKFIENCIEREWGRK